MGDMRGILSKRHSAWSGADISDPVELFISSIENDSSSEKERLEAAWESISSDENTPAGRWKSTKAGDFQSWNDLKTNLLDAFGGPDSYTVRDKLEFVLSLQRRDSELFSSLLHRVGWVIENVLASNSMDDWKTIHFLLGLSALTRDSILKQLQIVDNLTAIVEGLDNCKQEVCDVAEEALEDSKFDVEKGYETNIEEKDPFEEIMTGDDDSKTNLKSEVDTEKTLELQYFGCKKCARLFTKGAELEQHMKQHVRNTSNNTKAPKVPKIAAKTECRVCGETFDHRSMFEAHMAELHPGTKPYKCQQCSMTFTQKNNLVNHTMIHTGEKPHQCNQCPKKFRRVQQLLQHKQIHNPGFVKPFQCEICQIRFLQRITLKKHMLQHEISPDGQPFQCKLCPGQFKDKYSLVKHLRLHDNAHKCKICKKKFKTATEMEKHAETHNEKEPQSLTTGGDDKLHTCKKCARKFLDKASLEQHLSKGIEGGKCNGSLGKTASTCHTCQEIFASRKKMEDHVFERHPETKPYKCQECSMVFTQNINLITHMKTHTGEKPFQCEICASRFARKFTLKQHMETHTGYAKNYPCDLCGKKLTSKHNLSKHIMMHKGEKPFQCEICSHRFIVKSALQTHMNTHSDEKPFECHICLGKFKTKVILKRHEETHKTDLPFQCQICSKMFKLQKHINTHMQIHSEEKNYECEICFKKFNQSCGKWQHMEVVHKKKKRYQCQVCSKKFGGSGDLKRHMKTHTREFFSKSESELDETMVNDT